MTWSDVQGHDEVLERFRRCMAVGRLASTFLFVGPSGIGKRLFAESLAQALLCERNPPGRLDACGQCQDCQMVAAGTHPDLDAVGLPSGKSAIPLELLIGDKEHRGQEGLCHRIALRPFRGGYKVAIIDDADYLNQEGANCLLKTLEEPPPRSVLILIGTSEQKQLPTIRSRCQVIRFRPLSDRLVADLVLQRGWVETPSQAAEMAELARGSLDQAAQWRDAELAEFRQGLLRELASGAWDPLELGRVIGGFVEQAGKDAAPRRTRLRLVIQLMTDYYTQLMRQLSGADMRGDARLREAVERGCGRWTGDAESAALAVERCISAAAQVDANANQATLLDCWLDDLSELAWHGYRSQASLQSS